MALRTIAGVVALALLSVLMAATCTTGRNPAEPFNAWAERNRFQQVNDTLGMEEAAKVCYLELKGDRCIGANRAYLDASCSKDCKRLGHPGGICSTVTSICICERPCVAEKDAMNPARARDEATNAGDI